MPVFPTKKKPLIPTSSPAAPAKAVGVPGLFGGGRMRSAVGSAVNAATTAKDKLGLTKKFK